MDLDYRFNYMRGRKFKEKRDSNLNLIADDADEQQFLSKRIESCIWDGDHECTFYVGQQYDLSIVGRLNRSLRK